jgi:DNA-binding winged helix-turn-helix (wHTH) protein/TolB-like protein/predicted Zn-dependent protease
MPSPLPLSTALPGRFRLGDWVVDSALGELVGDAGRVPLNGLSLALLLALVKRAGELSPTDSLIAEVWERGEVSDATLQQRVKLLRRALGDDSDTPRYIATVRGRGYRLLLQPQCLEELPAAAAAALPLPARRLRRWPWAVLALLVVLGLGYAGWYANAPAPANAQLADYRLVVLPLDGDDELLADGLTEQLIWSMSKVPGLVVIARSSSMSYKDDRRALAQLAPELARDLQVGSVLQGRFQRSGERLLITLTLSDVRSLRVRWSKRFDVGSDGLTGVHGQAALQVAQALGVPRVAEAPLAIDGDGYALYLQGRQHYLRYSAADNTKAMALFRASLARSPAYAPALAGLSDSYAQAVYQFGAPEHQLQDALRFADAAVALAPALAEAHKARGLALDLLGRRREAALSYHTASGLNPNYSDSLINEAILHWEGGRLASAYQLARRATALDPLDPYAYLITVQVLTSAGFTAEAQAILQQVHQHAPGNAMAQTIDCAHWLEMGQDGRAEAACQELLKQHADFAAGWLLSADVALFGGHADLAAQRFQTAAALGSGSDAFYARLRQAVSATPVRQAALLPLLRQLRQKIGQHNEDPDHQLQLAMLLTAMGQTDDAMSAVETAVQLGNSDRHWLANDPALALLRGHARFPALLARLDARLSREHAQLQGLLSARTPYSTH